MIFAICNLTKGYIFNFSLAESLPTCLYLTLAGECHPAARYELAELARILIWLETGLFNFITMPNCENFRDFLDPSCKYSTPYSLNNVRVYCRIYSFMAHA